MPRLYYVALLALLCVSGGLAGIGRVAPAAEVHVMPKLHIALHDGFRGNHVVITVDGNVVFNADLMYEKDRRWAKGFRGRAG